MTGRPTSVITVVHAPACHFCDDARAALDRLSGDYPLVVDLVDAEGELGRTLIDVHRAPMFPLVLIDGQFFSFGRLPVKKLRKLLDARAATAVQ